MLRFLQHRSPASNGFLAVSLKQCRHYGDKGTLHLTMEPLEREYEGIFQISLTRPEARNAVGNVYGLTEVSMP